MKFLTKKISSISLKWSSIFVAMLLSFSTMNCDKGEVIETIGGHSITTSEYQDYYATSVDLASRMAGADQTFVSRMICNPDSQLSSALNPTQHYVRYRDSLMVARVAEQEGFLDDPNVQRMLEQSRLQTIGQLYINAKLLQKVNVPEDAKIKVCEALRKKEPAKMKALSLDDCLEVAEGVLKRRLVQSKGKEVVNEIRESISIKKNSKIELSDYLAKLSLYNELREKGGCKSSSGSGSAPKEESKQASEDNK